MSIKDGSLDLNKLQGFKYFEQLDGMLERLRTVGTRRDRAGNRELYFDQYATLMILHFFNPTATTLRGLRQFTTLEKLPRLCGGKPTSLGSLSGAARVFDPQALEPIIRGTRVAGVAKSRGVSVCEGSGAGWLDRCGQEFAPRVAANGVGLVAGCDSPRGEDACSVRGIPRRAGASDGHSRQRFGA